MIVKQNCAVLSSNIQMSTTNAQKNESLAVTQLLFNRIVERSNAEPSEVDTGSPQLEEVILSEASPP